jgi:hypothetical protein
MLFTPPSALYKTFLGLVLLTLLHACKKEETAEDDSDVATQGIISGKVILPAGSSISVNSLSTYSSLEQTPVKDGSFSVKSFPEELTTQLVLNPSGEVLLMGLHYPGQTDRSISATSTALALVLNTKVALFLSDEGKQALAAKVQAAPEFSALVREVEASVKANRPLFDTTNTALMQSLSTLFQKAALKMADVQGYPPVGVNQAGKELSFINNSRAHSSVVGIYKDNVRLQKIVVEGLQYFPTSVSEALNGYGGVSADPIMHNYTMPGDGRYEIRIRTGQPGADDGTPEHREAFYENLALFSFHLLGTFMPGLDPKSTCSKKTILTNLLNIFQAVPDIIQSKSVAAAVYTAESVAFQSVGEILSKCNTPFNGNYFKAVAKYFNLIDKTFSMAGGAANTTVFALHWTASDAVTDQCMSLAGTTVTHCFPITLTPLRIEKAGQKESCYGGAFNIYYLVFSYTDPQKLIASNLSNLTMEYEMERNGCIATYNTNNAQNSSYFAQYPIKIEDGKIWVPCGTSLGVDNSNWMKFFVVFTKPATGYNVPISNRIAFTVTRGGNWP